MISWWLNAHLLFFVSGSLAEITGTPVNEIQVMQSYSPDVPEVQQIDISTAIVQSKQTFGLVIKNVKTDDCTQNGGVAQTPTLGNANAQDCTEIEDHIDGSIRLYWNPNDCGGGAYADDNWCYKALQDAGVGDVGCGTNKLSCTTKDIKFMNISDLKNQFCGLKGSGASPYQHTDSDCVDIIKTGKITKIDALTGEYVIYYEFTFKGLYHRGQTAALKVFQSNDISDRVRIDLNTYTDTATATIDTSGTYTDDDGSTVTLASAKEVEVAATVTVAGNQPDGNVFLTYECESRTRKGVKLTSVNGYDIGVDVPILNVSASVRIGTNYYRVTAVSNGGLNGTLNSAYVGPDSNADSSVELEVGEFYSNPEAANGVSDNCLSQRVYTTATPLAVAANALDMVGKIRSLSSVIDNNDPNSIVVTRSHYLASESRVGYKWQITFNRQNGDLSPIVCSVNADSSVPSSLGLQATSTGDASQQCEVTTLTEGSLIDGQFKFDIDAPGLPWNIDADDMATYLSTVGQLGAASVTRSPYLFENDKRWSGAYLWTISFTRSDQIPKMRIIEDLTLGLLPESGAYTNFANISVGTYSERLVSPFEDPFHSNPWIHCSDLEISERIKYDAIRYDLAAGELSLEGVEVGFFKLIRKVVLYAVKRQANTEDRLIEKIKIKITPGTSKFPLKFSPLVDAKAEEINFLRIKIIGNRVEGSTSTAVARAHPYWECVEKAL